MAFAPLVLPGSSCPHCSATSQQSRELDVVVIQVDPLEAGQSCVAEESLPVVSHPRLAIGQGREGQRGVIAEQTHFVESERLVAIQEGNLSQSDFGTDQKVNDGLAIQGHLQERAPVGEQSRDRLSEPSARLVDRAPVGLMDREQSALREVQGRGHKLMRDSLRSQIHQQAV